MKHRAQPLEQAQPSAVVSDSPSVRYRTAILLLAILLGAGALRFYHLGHKSMWLDELYSLASANARYPDPEMVTDQVLAASPRPTHLDHALPWTGIWGAMHQGTHPPLYILILRPWREVFGTSDAAARALSAVWSIIALALLFELGRLLFSARAALGAAGLMAVAWPQVDYAQEARPYAMLLALGLGALVTLARIERLGANIGRLITLAGLMLAMALTHYFSIGGLLAIGLYTLIRFRGRVLGRTLLAIGSSAALFLVLWGPAIWSQRHTTDFGFLDDSAPGHALRTLTRALQLPVRYFIEFSAWNDYPEAQKVIVAVSPWAGAALLALVIWQVRRRREFLLPLLWSVTTISAIAGLDLARETRHLEYIRYTLLASPGVYLALAAMLFGGRKRSAGAEASADSGRASLVATAVLGVLVALCLLHLPTLYAEPKEPWREVATLLRDHAGPGEPIVYADPRPWYQATLAMCASHYDWTPSRPAVILTRPPSRELLQQLPAAAHLWVFTPGGTDAAQAAQTMAALFPGYAVGKVYPFSMTTLIRLDRG